VERDIVSLFLQGREIKPYNVQHSGKLAVIPYKVKGGKPRLLSEVEMRRRYPRAYEYLEENREHLQARERGRMRGSDWYGFIYPKNIEIMREPKMLVPDIADRASFALDADGVYAFTSGYGITLREDTEEGLEYVLGLLNSTTLDFYLKRISTTMRGGFFRYFTQYIHQLPIRKIDFSDRADKARHDKMVSMVQRMLDLHKRVQAAKTQHERGVFQRQIAATDEEIDRFVYELYGLTEEEIRTVEETTQKRATEGKKR